MMVIHKTVTSATSKVYSEIDIENIYDIECYKLAYDIYKSTRLTYVRLIHFQSHPDFNIIYNQAINQLRIKKLKQIQND